jgi:hypothetical protein
VVTPAGYDDQQLAEADAREYEAVRAAHPHLSGAELRLTEMWFDLDLALLRGPVTGIIVGERPGPGTSPALPMYPYPAGSAGGRLLAISRMPLGDYLGRLMRVNLLREYGSTWPVRQAADRASEFVAKVWEVDTRVVACGSKVAAAFASAVHRPWPVMFEVMRIGRVELIAIPHPSGRNKATNDPGVRRQMRRAVRWAADYKETEDASVQ